MGHFYGFSTQKNRFSEKIDIFAPEKWYNNKLT